MTKDITDLVSAAIPAWYLLVERCKAAGLEIVATCVKRELIEQVALYAQGRESFSEVCRLRKLAGLWPIGEEEAAKKVTWTFLSTHIPEICNADGKVYGVDFALKRCIGGVNAMHWNVKVDVNGNDEPDYIEVGRIAEECGFKSGMRFKDYCHIQWRHKK